MRDLLLGHEPKDFDVATDARPEQVMALFEFVIPVGLEHGTVTVVFKGENVEVTTFRRANTSYEDGRTHTSCIEEDLAARDFTCNALAWQPSPGVIVDPFGGTRDIEDRVLRATGRARDRFAEDPLRVMRACRFAACLEMSIEDSTLAAMGEFSLACSACSVERLTAELFKILGALRPSVGIELMDEVGLLELFFPELAACKGNYCLSSSELDLFEYSLCVMDLLSPSKPLLRLASLFRSLGRQFAADTVSGRSTALAAHRLEVFRTSRDQERTCIRLVRDGLMDCPSVMEAPLLRRLLSRFGPDLVHWHMDLLEADCRVLGGEEALKCSSELRRRFDELRSESCPLYVKELTISGRDVIEVLQVSPGPVVGEILSRVLEHVLDDPSLNTRSRLLTLLERMRPENTECRE